MDEFGVSWKDIWSMFLFLFFARLISMYVCVCVVPFIFGSESWKNGERNWIFFHEIVIDRDDKWKKEKKKNRNLSVTFGEWRKIEFLYVYIG